MLNRFCMLTAAAMIVTASGCGREEPIHTYEVPQLSGTATADVDANAETNEPTHRMLAAIVRGETKAWFFKLSGSLSEVEQAAGDVNQFYRDLKFDDAADRPKWTTPENWEQQDASGMRLATLKIPAGEATLEMSVIGLPAIGDWESQLLDNINRWRGQMKLPPTLAGGLAAETTPLDNAPQGSVAVDLQGADPAGAMTAPFAGGAPFANLPAAPSPSTKPPNQQKAPPADASPLKYELPEGWVELPANRIRLANLKTSADADAAEVKAFAFPATGDMVDPLANVNRWRGEVGLDATEQGRA